MTASRDLWRAARKLEAIHEGDLRAMLIAASVARGALTAPR